MVFLHSMVQEIGAYTICFMVFQTFHAFRSFVPFLHSCPYNSDKRASCVRRQAPQP
ncbi:hypothetical protein Mapa_008198 [Marchantia paleacea]|nr:hypothetical protein Mapa_008198 [Marchantia paleacea]